MRPTREQIRRSDQTCFVSLLTAGGLPLFRNERWAIAFLNTLERYSREYALHDFVVMPDQVHLLLSPHCPLERVVQLIKGGYSFNARRAFEWKGDIWQAGFSDHRILDEADWHSHIAYIEKKLASLRTADYRFCGRAGAVPLAAVPAWLKPHDRGEQG